MIEGSVGGLLTSNNIGRVDQLEDRYLGMVEAPSSNLGVSTSPKKRTAFEYLGSEKHNSSQTVVFMQGLKTPSKTIRK
jgi:hypothetical protein